MRHLVIGAVLLMAAPALAEFCESWVFTPLYRCGGHKMIETRCWDGDGAGPDARFEGYAQHPNGTLQHVKVTCGDGDSYLLGYDHYSCASGVEQYAAAGTQASCCGTTSAQIAANCPEVEFQSDGMPCPDGCFP